MSTDINSQVSASISALERELNIISHNLANASTVGYKRISSAFAQSLHEQQASLEQSDTEQVQLDLALDFSQGLSLQQTGRALDFALCGKGFFVIETPEGPLYTRNGMFQLNQNRQIVDSQGRIVAGQAGPITVPTDISLSQLTVSADGSLSAAGQTVGAFRLVDFPENEEQIVPAGNSCYKVPEDLQSAGAQNIVVKQGFLESSNVKIVDELVNMIMVSRLYEANMKLVTANKDAVNSLMGVAMG